MLLKTYNTIISSDGTVDVQEISQHLSMDEYFISKKELIERLSIKLNRDFSLRLLSMEDNIPLSKIYHTLERLNALDVLGDNIVVEPTDVYDATLYLSVPNANLRIVLVRYNLFTMVDNAIRGSNNEELIQFWDYANYIDYTNPNVAMLAASLSLDTEMLKTLFVEACLL